MRTEEATKGTGVWEEKDGGGCPAPASAGVVLSEAAAGATAAPSCQAVGPRLRSASADRCRENERPGLPDAPPASPCALPRMRSVFTAAWAPAWRRARCPLHTALPSWGSCGPPEPPRASTLRRMWGGGAREGWTGVWAGCGLDTPGHLVPQRPAGLGSWNVAQGCPREETERNTPRLSCARPPPPGSGALRRCQVPPMGSQAAPLTLWPAPGAGPNLAAAGQGGAPTCHFGYQAQLLLAHLDLLLQLAAEQLLQRLVRLVPLHSGQLEPHLPGHRGRRERV